MVQNMTARWVQGELRARQIHGIDLENLVGSSHLSESLVAQAAAAYRQAVGLGPLDLVIVAVSHHNEVSARFGWGSSAHFVVRSGPDGADLALIEALREHAFAEACAGVVIASGDHIFTDLTIDLHRAGRAVTVAGGGGFVSARLRLAAQSFIKVPMTWAEELVVHDIA
jgi:phage tail sheath gpL-like